MIKKLEKATGSSSNTNGAIPKHMVKSYVSTMLTELATMAKEADLNNLSSLLRATECAARIDAKNLE